MNSLTRPMAPVPQRDRRAARRLLCSAALLAATGAHAGAVDDFRQSVAASIRATLAEEQETAVGLFGGRRPQGFFLYGRNENSGPPFINARCGRSVWFSVYVAGTGDSGRNSLGGLKVGICDPHTEIDAELIARQGPMSKLLIDAQRQTVPQIRERDIPPYRALAIGDGLTLHVFTLLALGHGAAISPTAIVTAGVGDPVILMQFGMPPRCEQAVNPHLSACTDPARFFTRLALRLRASGAHLRPRSE